MTSVLSARGISVSFGGVHAVVGVDLDVEPGQLVGLIGPNGAGKTTLIDAITGFVPHRGTVSIDGRDVTGSKPHVRARRGLARTWQATELFDDLTVRENLTVAARHPTVLETIKELFSSQVSQRRSGRRSTRAGSRSASSPTPCRPSSPRASARWCPSPGPCRHGRSCCCSTSRQPGSTRTNRSRWGTGCVTWSTTGSRCCSSTTTWGWCSGSAISWWWSSRARVIGRGTPAEIRENPRVVEAYLGAADRLAPTEASAPAHSRDGS